MLHALKHALLRCLAAYGLVEAPARRRPQPIRILNWSR